MLLPDSACPVGRRALTESLGGQGNFGQLSRPFLRRFCRMVSSAWLLHVYKDALEKTKTASPEEPNVPLLRQAFNQKEETVETDENVSSMIRFYCDQQSMLFEETHQLLQSKKRRAVIDYLEGQPENSFITGNSCKKLLVSMKEQQKFYEEKITKEDEMLRSFSFDHVQVIEKPERAALVLEAESWSEGGAAAPDEEGMVQIPVARTQQECQQLWTEMANKEIPKAYKAMNENQQWKVYICHRLSNSLIKDYNRFTSKEVISQRELISKSKRMSKEVYTFWKKNEKEEKEARKRAEKEEIERKKRIEEQREANRQAKKLNFLITQTELYTHFVLKKNASNEALASEEPIDEDALEKFDAKDPTVDFDTISESMLKEKARRNALEAANASLEKARKFDQSVGASQKLLETGPVSEQPKFLTCQLKGYQLKGLNWLANLYEQGINGILADEMGLGKTVQSISLLAYLAERHQIYGPFIVVTPASTLHNWQQEITKFCPSLKVLPYWGNINDRTMLRKYWNVKKLGQPDAPFHVLVTSYQLIVSDEKHFKRINWQYMILDEAQAIKSSSSLRWKTLLSINCRNRLLLTGTPIQNTMQELWALLHFIMPTLFDSHEEFSEWFSKEIESHAEQKSTLNETQLARLHMILKPFMLRRTKKEVECELASKVEVELLCELTPLQTKLYEKIKGKASIDELLDKVIDFSDGTGGPFGSSSHHGSGATLSGAEKTLMNLVMQLRKVCNHPELFERVETKTPHSFTVPLTTCSESGAGVLYGIGSNPISISIPKCIIEEPTSVTPNSNLWKDVRDIHSNIQKYQNFIFPFQQTVELLEFPLCFDPVYRLPQMHFPTSVAPAPEISCLSSNFVLKRQHCKVTLPIPTPSALTAPLQVQSMVNVPDLSELILKSGKMILLDGLLRKLKEEGHRVLLYFQMTKMITIMEEYLTFKGYNYLRLDGSCKISERRDMVNEFQSNPSVFIFLLSTRAGGLGINLTAADTVIFYDSDWNPTVDQQAMDRAHRLGQTKQVTVYRLITRGTVEERILIRAKQKGEIHKLVVANSVTAE